MNGKNIFILIVILIAVSTTYVVSTGNVVSDKIPMTVYKSANCGCCAKWIPYIQNKGFLTETIMTEDMQAIKEEYNIPRSMESCHTAIVGDYFIEGHIPIEAINKLLEEQPDIDGISLPNMPAGSPGMPGIKSGQWIIYAIKDGKTSTFMKI
ncbi:hypothetical protein ISS08_00340 [Candidatus Pacearchaeota archaeon]|nr:hypothetical protein [Candidatus Pacearchaeota archaeon]